MLRRVTLRRARGVGLKGVANRMQEVIAPYKTCNQLISLHMPRSLTELLRLLRDLL